MGVCLDSFEFRMGEFSCLSIHIVPFKVLWVSRQIPVQGRCNRTCGKLTLIGQQLSGKETLKTLKWYLVPVLRSLSQAPNGN